MRKTQSVPLVTALSVVLAAAAAPTAGAADSTQTPNASGSSIGKIGADHGTTEGVVDALPTWSAGVQLGTQGATGLVGQAIGVYGGAANFGLGFGGGALSIFGDFVFFLENGFDRRVMGHDDGYNSCRGQAMPYGGFGLMAAKGGVAVRFPLGVQYTMERDPISFFGTVTPTFGKIIEDATRPSFQAQASLGVRVLL